MAIKKLSNLSVIEAKVLLEKRGLDSSGDRNDLLLRLKKAMEDEKRNSGELALTGIRAENTATTDNGRNASGVEEQMDEIDVEVVEDGFGGNDGDNRTGNVCGTSEGDNLQGREGRQESKTEDESKETRKPISALWISNLTLNTKASDLKLLLSKYGQVNTAKVVASAKSESKRFGLVTMSTPEEALECITNLNNTDFMDATITVEFDPKQLSSGGGKGDCSGSSEKRQSMSEQESGLRAEEPPLMTTLWISGLPETTKAADLKEIFTKHGEVLRSKVAASSKNPDAKLYFGIVTMATVEQADDCFEKLNQTEINGQVVTIEKRKTESKPKPAPPPPPSPYRSTRERSPRPYDRDRFYESRGDYRHESHYRGRRFPPRPFPPRGRGLSFRGRGREAFSYMDEIRADYERHMENERRGRDDDSWGEPRGRGRFSSRSRPYDRSGRDGMRGEYGRDLPGNEPYWGSASKRPRMDDPRGDERPPRESGGRMAAGGGRSGNEGSWGGSNRQQQGDGMNQSYMKPRKEQKDFGAKTDWKSSNMNASNQGSNAGGSRNQWQPSGNVSTTGSSSTYQSAPIAYSSNYNSNQSHSGSGINSSSGSSNRGGLKSSFNTTSTASNYGNAGNSGYSNTGDNSYGGNSYGGTGSGSYGGAVGNAYSGAGGSSYGGAGGMYSAVGGSSGGSYGGSAGSFSGGGSYGNVGGSSFAATGNSSYGGMTSSSFGASGGSYGASGSGSYGAGATQGGSFGAAQGGSYGGAQNNSYGSNQGGSYGGTQQNSSFGGAQSGSFGATQGGTYGGTQNNMYGGAQGSSFGAAQSGSYGGTQNNSYGATSQPSYGSMTGTMYSASGSYSGMGVETNTAQSAASYVGTTTYVGAPSMYLTTTAGSSNMTAGTQPAQYNAFKPQGGDGQSYSWY